MTTKMLPPPITPPAQADAALKSQGFAVLDADGLGRLLGAPAAELASLAAFWDHLPPDDHLRDGGRYRRRRHSSFVVEGDRVEQVAHRAHWQPVEYNALHGGIERWFDPIESGTLNAPAWNKLLAALAQRASALRGPQRWFVEAHPFRIDASAGIGRPTPEGAHRDGVDLVAVILVARRGVKGGETRVFHADGPQGMRFTLSEPWTAMLLDDARVIHETTPIQPLDPSGGQPAHRDTLVLTYRSGGFQSRESLAPQAL